MVAGVTGLSPQMASRHVALLAVLKLVPRWVATLLVRTGLIYRISPVFRVAATSHSDAVARLTADPDLRALLSYLFYGQGCHDREGVSRQGGHRGDGGDLCPSRGRGVVTGDGSIAIGLGGVAVGQIVSRYRRAVSDGEGCTATVRAMSR